MIALRRMADTKVRFRLFAKRTVRVPTLWGWLVLSLGLVLLLWLGSRTAYPFLAYNHPTKADVAIIEGWVPDHVLVESIPLLGAGQCGLIITTGGPLEYAQDLSQYKTYADLTAARLIEMGVGRDKVVSIPSPRVDRDRTYAAAMAVEEWLRNHPDIERANLITKGPHARRSFIIFRHVLPSTFELGVCAVAPQDYDPQRWWSYSEGFRTVVSEAIAYTYAKLMGPR